MRSHQPQYSLKPKQSISNLSNSKTVGRSEEAAKGSCNETFEDSRGRFTKLKK